MAISENSALQAVLWDFDGTLVDTEPLWQRAEIEFMARYGARWTSEQAAELTGSSWKQLTVILREAAAKQGKQIDIDDYGIYQTLVNEVVTLTAALPVPWQPGAQELLAQCAAAGLKLALVSASPEVMLNGVLDRIEQSFQAVVDGEQVPNSKPAPDGYLMAAERLGVPIENCIVIEDSKPGVAAGLASGAPVVALRTTYDHAPNPAMVALNSLAGVNLADLERWHAELGGSDGQQ